MGAPGGRGPPADFRVQLSAAPLKLGRRAALAGRSSDFRVQLSAAPLKLGGPRRFCELGAGFPRSIERGPIEARPSSGLYRHPGYFRVQLSAAPLKLLEPFTSGPPLQDFRVQLSAAPLKLQITEEEVGDAWRFPRSIERGPIEAALQPVPR